MVGDDQREWFMEDIQPTFSIYYGEEVVNTAYDEEKANSMAPGLAYSMRATHPTKDQIYPCDAELASKIIEQAIEDEFDIIMTIADERAMSQEHSPFKTIESLSTYLQMRLEEELRESQLHI